MAQEQTDQDLSDLENRLERLRILYEQYFMGIEKREPGVQRKEVVRRIQQLRKVRFQSTVVRFKFQTIVQRYNTLQQYWNRTCREIENGTYRRHVIRAERRFATDPPAQHEEQERTVSPEQVRERAANDLAAMLDADLDLEKETSEALASLDKPATDTATSLAALGKRTEEGRKPVGPTLHLGKAPEIKDKPVERSSLSPGRTLSPKPKGLAPLPKRSATGSPPSGLTNGPPEKAAPAPLGKAPPAPVAKPAPAPVAKPAPAPPSKAAPAPLGKAPPAPVAKPAPAPLSKPAPPRPAPVPPRKTAPAPPQPPAPKPPERKGPPPAPSMRPKPAPPGHGLSEHRIRDLHLSYVDARKKTNATAVSYEKLERNIRETEKRLQEKHKGKQIDFEVSIRDGKAILKPRLK